MIEKIIEKIKVNNFQSHSDTEIVFSPNVTVITGRSQSGKTAILRAFRWLTENRPKGFRFHSYFSEEPTKVFLWAEGNQILHEKSDNKEQYQLNEKVFKGMGFDVPDEILSILNLGVINIQDQLEEPFLITSSPGNFARVINEITNLDKVDNWVSSLTTRINSTNKEISLTENDIQVFEKKISQYENLEQIAPVLELYDSIEKKIDQQKTQIENFKEMLQDIQYNSEAIDSLYWIDEATGLYEEVKTINSLVEKKRIVLEEWNHFVEVSHKVENIEKILPLWNDFQQTHSFIKKMSDVFILFEDLERIDEEIETANKAISQGRKNYKELLKKNKICPICFSSITDAQLNKIEELI